MYPWPLGLIAMSLKEQFLEGTDWTTDIGGTLICPHGNRCEDDLREHGDCGCASPMVEAGLI
jgi:hypothetical protein